MKFKISKFTDRGANNNTHNSIRDSSFGLLNQSL